VGTRYSGFTWNMAVSGVCVHMFCICVKILSRILDLKHPATPCNSCLQKDCQARNLNREDAVDRGRWKKPIKTG